MKSVVTILFLEIILQTKQIYYISFDVTVIDNCLTKIYKNKESKILYKKTPQEACSPDFILYNPVLFQYEFIFGDKFYFEIYDSGGFESYFGMNARINEYFIEPKLQKFWYCVDCKTKDKKYIYNSDKQVFYFYAPKNDPTPSYFHIYFQINKESDLINLNNIVDTNYYTLYQAQIDNIYSNNLDSEISLINFKDINTFYVTHDYEHEIPFETIYFRITFDKNIIFSGKIMGYNFNTKKYEELNDNSYFEIKGKYSTLNYIFSSEEKNNHGTHIKINIITYNSPKNIKLSKTVSNLETFEYYICQNGYYKCDNNFYLNCITEFKCYEFCPRKINTNKKCKYCHPDCNKCFETFNENSTNCISCLSTKKYLQYGNCISECKNGYYNETIDNYIVKKCKCDFENCYICSLESLNENNSCITCNNEKGYFELYNDINNINYIHCYKFTEGFYIDNYLYKKCHDSCKQCDKKGNELMHNCLECKNNYNYIIQYGKYKNCYIICSYYYYFDRDINQLFCTLEMKCEGKFNKLILGSNECIDECNKVLKYKYKNICYPECPEGTYISEIKPYFCEVICYEEKPFELIEEQECSNNCSISELKKKNCLIKYIDNTKRNNTNKKELEIIAQDVILENFRNEITYYNTSDADNGKDDIFEDKKMTITLTTSENQINDMKKENNISQINLGKCESLLREYYKIQNDSKIYIMKIEKPIKGMKIPKIEYYIYYKLNNSLIELNKSICDNIKIDIILPVTIDEDIDKLNSSSDYYNSICYPTTSIYNTDLTLDDRRKEFIDKNKTVCQDNCIFYEYNYTINKAICSCHIQKSSNFFKDIIINKTLLYRNFIHINNIANLKILGCYKELLNKKGIIKNIGFYIFLLIEIIHLICTIIFYCKELKIIDNDINNITFAIKNWKLVIKEEEKKKKKKGKNVSNNNTLRFGRKKKDLNNYTTKKNHKNKKIIKFHNNPIKKKQNPKGNNNIKRIVSSLKKKRAIKNKKIIVKCKTIMKFNYSEMNKLEYKLALKYDHRTYSEYYFSLLKTKHILIVIFFNNKDHNSRAIKFDLFFISFAISYTVNALFFIDKIIHQIYEDEGIFNFIYNVPRILYSFLISFILNSILKPLALSESAVIKYKQNKNIKDLDKRKISLKRKLRFKFVFYFILGFIVLLFCWFYLTMFCAVYKNTQVYLIKDTLISFGLFLFYPLLINLAPGIFRIPSLSNKKKQRIYLYLISKLLQII